MSRAKAIGSRVSSALNHVSPARRQYFSPGIRSIDGPGPFIHSNLPDRKKRLRRAGQHIRKRQKNHQPDPSSCIFQPNHFRLPLMADKLSFLVCSVKNKS